MFCTNETQNTLLHGPVCPALLRYAFPIILSMVATQFYSVADTMIIGLRLDADALAAVSNASTVLMIFLFISGGMELGGGLLVAAGKAAWQMAHTAVEVLGRVDGGVVVTKYDHGKGEIPGVACYEAGHPVPDENGFAATEQALELVRGLTAEDTVLFLLSGGGSALFEKPLIPAADLEELTHNLLVCGADIVEINTLRKRFSGVKGGRFAQLCAPAHVVSIVLSDILGDPLDMIASGPAYTDSSTCAQAKEIVQKYHLPMTEQMLALLERRLAVCRAIAEYKRQNGLPVRDPARETEKLHEAMERGGAAGQRLVALLMALGREEQERLLKGE